MEYFIEQYPKNKDFDISKLSTYQVYIRKNEKIKKFKKTKVCNKCFHRLPIEEFYIKNKDTNRYSNSCRDCQLKSMGILEIGKTRFSMKILDKGFRRCSICKEIKPLTDFYLNKSKHKGISNNCKECSRIKLKNFQDTQRDNLGDFYVKQYGKNKGINEFTEDIINKLREELKEKRKPKFNVDGIDFYTIKEFAEYIKEEYNNPITQTYNRLLKGKSPEQCKLSEKEIRSSAYTKGQIKLTDTITGKVYLFKNTVDAVSSKMIGYSSIIKGIKTKKPVGGYGGSLWKNPLIVERV